MCCPESNVPPPTVPLPGHRFALRRRHGVRPTQMGLLCPFDVDALNTRVTVHLHDLSNLHVKNLCCKY